MTYTCVCPLSAQHSDELLLKLHEWLFDAMGSSDVEASDVICIMGAVGLRGRDSMYWSSAHVTYDDRNGRVFSRVIETLCQSVSTIPDEEDSNAR